MVLTRKNRIKQYPFVDREDYIQTFTEAVNNIGQKEFSILVYYGVAGIGKTSLRKELPKYLDEHYVEYPNKKLVWASIDLQFDKHREKSTFLISMKNELQRKYKINFPAFEIAHAIYWKKANPEIPLRKENYLFFEGDNAFDDFFGVVDKIPYFSIVPATAKLIKSSLTSLQKWWKTIGEAELLQLSEKEPQEIEEYLPNFWAQDLNNYLERNSKSVVLFIDTYEALWEKERGQGTFNSRDEWIRKLILNLPKSSLWVICGREELRWKEVKDKVNIDWNNYLEQYKLEKLPKENALEFLNLCRIKENEIQKVILKASECVPYYLELEVDTYAEISKTCSPKPADFAKTHSEIFDRFMKYLNGPEQETLKVISIPRFWNRDIFSALIEKFKTCYPLTAFSELKRFSFVQETEGKLLLHPLMRESLQVYQDQEVKKEVHGFMCDYYTNQLNSIDIKAITQEHEFVLTEAFYHAKESLETEDLLNWFITVSDPFDRAAFWQLIAPMYEEILQVLEAKLGPEHPDVATTLNNLAVLYRYMGSYEKSLPLNQKALDISEKVLGPEHLDLAVILDLAVLYRYMGSYEKSLPLYQKALDISEKVLGPEHPDLAVILSELAVLYRCMGSYEKALPLHQRALEIYEKVLRPEHPDAATLNNLAVLYDNVGSYEKALPLYQKALDISEKILGPQHPGLAVILSNLARLYGNMGSYEKALPLYQRALEIIEKVMGPEHPTLATILNNLALLYDNLGSYEKALPLYQRALNIREKVLEPGHPYIATTLSNLARLYDNLGSYEKALLLYQRALEIYEKVLGPEHPDVATTLNNLAELYRQMGSYEKVTQLKEKYPAFFEKTRE